MKKISKKLFSLVLVLGLLLSNFSPLMPMQKAYAIERTPVTQIEGDSDMVVEYGGEVKTNYQFNFTIGESVVIPETMGDWYKYNELEDDWEEYTNPVFREGTYLYRNQVRIENADYVLDESATVTIDGEAWTRDSDVFVYENYSYAIYHSQEFEVTVNPDLVLTFLGNDTYNIGENYVGIAINTYSVAGGAIGGAEPYTFSKVSGPSWISVAGDGTISGTPTEAGTNEDLVVRVTDSESATKDITITVGETYINPANREEVLNVVATSTFAAPVYGGNVVSNYEFTITEGTEAHFDNTMGRWYKSVNDEWVQYNESTFTAGSYYYSNEVRIDGAEGRLYVLSDNTEVSVNDVEWSLENPNSGITVTDDYSFGYFRSPTYVVSEPEPDTYTVSFNTDGGSEMPSQQVVSGGHATDPGVPTKENYRFVDWFADSLCTTPFDFSVPVTADTIVYAGWELITVAISSSESSTVNFGSHEIGDSINGREVTIYNNGNAPISLTAEAPVGFSITGLENEVIINPSGSYIVTLVANSNSTEGTHNGTFVFTGTEVGGTERTVTTNVDVTVTLTEPVIVEYTVTFIRDGENEISHVTVEEGQTVSAPNPNPTWEGHRFLGWFADALCTTPFDFSIPITADTPIYAKWVETATVTIDVNGGVPLQENVFVVDKGTTLIDLVTANNIEFTHSNPLMIVDGAVDGNNQQLDMNTVINGDMTVRIIWLELQPVSEIELTLDAPTEGDIISLTYDPVTNNYFPSSGPSVHWADNAGYGVYNPSWVTAACASDSSMCTTLFEGTFNNGVDYYAAITVWAEDGYIIPSGVIDNLTVNGEEPLAVYEVEENSRYVVVASTRPASPQPTMYTVTFDTDGGSAVASVDVASGSTVSQPTPNPTKANYIFGGWYEDSLCTTPFNFATTAITATTTIYAKWTPKVISIVADPNEINYGNFIIGSESITRQVTIRNTGNVSVVLSSLTNPANGPFDSTAIDNPILSPYGEYKITISVPTSLAQTAGEYEGVYTISAVEAPGGDDLNTSTTITTRINVTTGETPQPTMYTVAFNSNGGSAVASQEVEEGQTATVPAQPTRDNYNFLGWFDQALENEYDFATPVTGNLTLYAKWEEVAAPQPTMYTVAFNSNGGSAVASEEVEEGQTATVPAQPTKDNYNFLGWFDQALENEYDFATPVTGNLTLYAKWEEVAAPQPTMYTVTFNSNGGSAVASEEVEEGQTATVPAQPTKDNYNFLGWFDQALENEYDFATPVTGNLTLYAKWEAVTGGEEPEEPELPASYTVTFNSNGGSEVESQTVESGNKATEPAEPTKMGFTFVKWYKDSTLTVEYDFEEKVTSNITLYAKWENIYSILDGDKQEFDPENPEDLEFRASGNVEDLVKVLLDNKELDPKNYEVKEGSTIIILKAAFLKTLAGGNHVLTYVYNNGSVDATFTVAKEEEEEETNPKTYDNVMTWVELLGVSTLGLGLATYKLKKRNAK